eukprot:CAMPEP_0202919626 /NCGR_PEP_ID=MMETSP1392-20130828/76323_1 /ASSEMBLY_ACC=CAM_ASM_000868 /TAXON_ID=225041 /ORGANISM="Chlamydomonas chlamydogama, Strain SAG 11-48b" /LENGTH=54 /DNA_ID=CAMNT_0049613067 /DNA_START=18 /DNA_END=179 /DNA_ORIENTATION=+
MSGCTPRSHHGMSRSQQGGLQSSVGLQAGASHLSSYLTAGAAQFCRTSGALSTP